jgi:ribosomal protein L11 methyltransferase
VLRVVVPVASVESASDQLWVAGASAVSEEPADDGAVVLTADLDACPAALAAYEHDVFADDGSWRDGWRPFARAVEIGPFVVRPPWVASGSAARTLLVDAGHAFGTGAHPSTTLALAAIAEHVGSGRCRSVLDVGCGSGVLAIGAAMLGAAPVVAIDIDAAAIEATTANAEANGVDDAIEVTSTALDDVTGRFDLVAANLGSPLVVDLAAAIADRSVDVVVLSGLLADRWEHVPPAYPDFELAGAPVAAEWRALVLARR